MNKFSFFSGRGIKENYPKSTITLEDFVNKIKSSTYRDQIEKIRHAKTKGIRKHLKEALDYVTIAGIFKTRNLEDIEFFSSLCVLDFDGIENVEEIKDRLKENRFVCFMFVSPSGKGIKIVVKIPSCDDVESYSNIAESLYDFFENMYGLKGDRSTKDASRACFVSYDKEAYYNKESEIFKPKTIERTIKKTAKNTQEVKQLEKVDRSEIEAKEIMKLLYRGLTREQIYEQMLSFSKWAAEGQHYRNVTFEKVYSHYLEKQKELKTKYELRPMPLRELLDKEISYSYFIQDMFAESTINMLFSSPSKGKSLMSLYMAFCVAAGQEFLGLKTIKSGVAYFDWENAEHTIQMRSRAIKEGLGDVFDKFDHSKLHFFIGNGSIMETRSKASSVKQDFIETFEEFVKEKNIRFVVIDTIRRLGAFDENDAGAINTIYSEFLNYFRTKYGITFLFLHHANKEGKYRGSIDLEAICDAVYEVNDDNNVRSIKVRKKRNNELDELHFNAEFDNDENNILQKLTFKVVDKPESKMMIDFRILKDMLFNGEKFKHGENYNKKEFLDSIMGVLDCSLTTAKTKLNYLIERGLVKGEGRNWQVIANVRFNEDE